MVNWFKTYRDSDNLTNPRLATFVVDFNCDQDLPTSIFDSALDQAIKTVHQITRKYPPPYKLFISGGVDSQAMLWAWHLSKVEFEACHFDFGNNLNIHDRKYAEKFIEKNKLPISLRIIPFNAVDFIRSNELIKYAKKYDCSSPQIICHMKMCESVKGTKIFGGNYIEKFCEGSFNYTSLGILRYAEHNKTVVPLFLSYNPKIAYSFYRLSEQIKINKKTIPSYQLKEYAKKVEVYKRANFPIVGQPNKKTGFEEIKKLFDQEPIPKLQRIRYLNQRSQRPFDILFRYRLYEHIGLYSDNIIIKHHRAINKLLT